MVTDRTELYCGNNIDELRFSLDRWSLPRGSIGFGADLDGDYARRMAEAINAKLSVLCRGEEALQ
jgi:hypothetical protein